jgi:hypothetical protein
VALSAPAFPLPSQSDRGLSVAYAPAFIDSHLADRQLAGGQDVVGATFFEDGRRAGVFLRACL